MRDYSKTYDNDGSRLLLALSAADQDVATELGAFAAVEQNALMTTGIEAPNIPCFDAFRKRLRELQEQQQINVPPAATAVTLLQQETGWTVCRVAGATAGSLLWVVVDPGDDVAYALEPQVFRLYLTKSQRAKLGPLRKRAPRPP